MQSGGHPLPSLMQMNGQIKIALADLTYLSENDFVQPVPLNVGYIAAYLKENLPGITVELFKNPQKLYHALVKDPKSYTCLGLSNYDWNFNLNRHFVETIKQKRPEIITIMGGPNIDSGSDSGIKEFFGYFNWLDYYVIGEGEYRFTRLMKSILENGLNLEKVWPDIPGTVVGYDRKTGDILRGLGDEVGHCDCRTLPSPYLTGVLDEFLDNPHLVPIIETSRGCPYSCAYCCWGSSINSKIRLFDQQTVLDELHYISLRAQNPKKALFIADSNFGINKRDKEIAQTIKEINAENGAHKNIFMCFAKNFNDDIMEVAEILKDFTDISMSKQSVNPEVLKIIGRQNIPDNGYDRFHARLKQLGVSTFCELIYGLPGESLESFLDGVEKMYQKGINIVLYPLFLIKGARINSEKFRQKYQITSIFRMMPRYIGSYGEINSVEYEEILISHSTLSEDDSMKIRLFVFFHVLFYERMFTELIILLKEYNLNVAAFIRFMLNDRVNWPTVFEAAIGSFESDLKNELTKKEDLKFYFTRDELAEIREKAMDLNTYHFLKLISAQELAQNFKDYLFEVLKRYLSGQAISLDTEESKAIVGICFDKIPDFPEILPRKTLDYHYDLEAWIKEEGAAKLTSFKIAPKIEYAFELDQGVISDFNQQYDKLNNIALSLYQTRKNMIIRQQPPSAAYTYQRTRL